MILKGFKFGMLLQLAVGPVCFYIFDTGSKIGFLGAELGVLAVALVDAFYILFAILGVTAFLKKEKINLVFKFLGCAILFYFGAKTILGSISLNSISSNVGAFANPFIGGLMLTLSNPLTILFWAGVFTSKVAEERLDKKSLYLFGLGAVFSTIIFLSFAAAVGNVISCFMPPMIINILNIFVGLIFIYFAIRLLINKKETA